MMTSQPGGSKSMRTSLVFWLCMQPSLISPLQFQVTHEHTCLMAERASASQFFLTAGLLGLATVSADEMLARTLSCVM